MYIDGNRKRKTEWFVCSCGHSFQLKSGLYSKLSPNICFCQFLDYLSAQIDIISFGPVMQVRYLNLASYRERSGFSQPNKPECGLSKVSAMRD